MSNMAALKAGMAAKKAKQNAVSASRAKGVAIAQARDLAFATFAVVATMAPVAASMTPQVKERSTQETSTPGVFTYVPHADIAGVNTVFGRQPQEPAAEPEGLGEVGHG